MCGRVLICDDTMFMRAVISGALKEAGVEVVGEAANGGEAVARYQELKPDLVTMDVVMPDISGFEAVKRIRAMDPNAKILMVSAMGQEQLVDQAVAAGAIGFLPKPFTRQDLVARVTSALSAQ